MDKVRITAGKEFFNGDDVQWGLAFYFLWEYNMVSRAMERIRLDMNRNGLFVELVVSEKHFDSVMNVLEEFGYHNICAYRVEDDYFIGKYNLKD